MVETITIRKDAFEELNWALNSFKVKINILDKITDGGV